MEISYTRYRIYRECPWKYKILFLDGRRIPLNAKSSFGLSLHRALEAWLHQGDLTLEALHDCLRARWMSQGYADEEEEARWRSKAVRILSRFHGEESSRRTRLIAAEKEFFWTLGRHTVRGMIDRIDQRPDGGYELVDYKTGPGLPTEEQVSADPQLRFYALGAGKALGIKPSDLIMDFVAVGKRISVAYDASGEGTLGHDIAAAADSIEAGAFPADTRYCPRCDFRAECPYSASR